ncbi:transmembrane sensor [Bordetella ansorpii]|uniref:Transmembrane sensor n=1 Tax=Bordetella ansorpii TaxID=288768 RepID=A0A157RB49_9BORD|nr:FecR domain-containing protein [Bordetella ansorpii]SAI55187.1 transmembrane sensor [Bordetella ansorpii]
MRDMLLFPFQQARARTQARRWLLRLRSPRATQADVRAFEQWRDRHPAHVAAVHELGRALRAADAAMAAMPARLRAPAEAPRAPLRPALQRPGRRALLGGALAAGAAWIVWRPPLELWPGLDAYTADYRTGTGEQRALALADGVQVEMNTRTQINLHAQDAVRTIELVAGEAEIVAGEPLSGAAGDRAASSGPRCAVQSGRGRVLARTARLNVRHTGAHTIVTCLAGNAELDHPLRRLPLAAGQQVRYDDARVDAPQPAKVDAVSAWRQRQMRFDDEPLADVVDELNRYRPGRIILRNAQLGRMQVRATFSLDRLDDALTLIQDLSGAPLTRLPGGIVLLG